MGYRDDSRDANGYAYKDGITTRVNQQQQVLNEAWPYTDSNGRHARGIPDQPANNQRPCEVRLVFATDGETWLPAAPPAGPTPTSWSPSTTAASKSARSGCSPKTSADHPIRCDPTVTLSSAQP